MAVFQLADNLIFPPPELAEDNGLLAIGGDLSIERILLAYSMGIFPWYSEGEPVLWWSPSPRLILIPDEFAMSRSLRQTIRRGVYKTTFDTAFADVIKNCAMVRRKSEGGTWITSEMIDAFTGLHNAGYAHSVESWHEGRLAGGLYGIAIGGAFFGESMFAEMSNASKVAFAALVEKLTEWDYKFIDCQVTTKHLMSLGAKEVSRTSFTRLLKEALKMPTPPGKWKAV